MEVSVYQSCQWKAAHRGVDYYGKGILAREWRPDWGAVLLLTVPGRP